MYDTMTLKGVRIETGDDLRRNYGERWFDYKV